MRDSQDSKGGTLDEMPYSGERELVEPTSSRKTGRASSEGWCCHSTANTDLYLSENTGEAKMDKSLRKGDPVTRPKLGSSSRGGTKN